MEVGIQQTIRTVTTSYYEEEEEDNWIMLRFIELRIDNGLYFEVEERRFSHRD